MIDSFEADASCDETLECQLRKALKNYQVRSPKHIGQTYFTEMCRGSEAGSYLVSPN